MEIVTLIPRGQSPSSKAVGVKDQLYRSFNELTGEDWQEAADMWHDGDDTLHIATYFGVPEWYIYNNLKWKREIIDG